MITAKKVWLESTLGISLLLKYATLSLRFYFGFQNCFVTDRLAIKFFFKISADFVQNSIIIFKWVIIFNQKIHPSSLCIITFHIFARFWKHYMKWFNFIIIIQVTSKVVIVFFQQKKILLDTNTFSVSIYILKIGLLW